jgi:hypothetical protein
MTIVKKIIITPAKIAEYDITRTVMALILKQDSKITKLKVPQTNDDILFPAFYLQICSNYAQKRQTQSIEETRALVLKYSIYARNFSR